MFNGVQAFNEFQINFNQLVDAFMNERLDYIREISGLRKSFNKLESMLKVHETRSNQLEKTNKMVRQKMIELKRSNEELKK